MLSQSKNQRLVAIFLIMILGFIVYANSLRGGFIWDDNQLIRDNLSIRSRHNLPKLFTGAMYMGSTGEGIFYRPLQMFTYAMDYSLWGLNVKGYHLTNAVLHILVALTVYWLINILFCDGNLALLVSLLFATHPIHTEAVAYISGRADILAALFIILSIIVLYKNQISSRNTKMRCFLLVTYIFALLSKEYSLITPAFLILCSYMFKNKLPVKYFLYVLAVTIIYILVRVNIPDLQFYPIKVTSTFIQRMPGFFAAIAEYVRLLIFPFNLHMEYGLKIFGFKDPRVIFGCIILFTSLTYAFKKRKSNKLLSFSIFWFFIALLPVSNLYPINAYMAEHWLYLPSLGFFLILANGLNSLYKIKYRPAAIVLIILILSYYSFLTIRQNTYWREPLAFFRRTMVYVPGSPRICHELAKEYAAIGRTREAIELYKHSIELNPDFAISYNDWGIECIKIGNVQEAVYLFKKALDIDSSLIWTFYNIANAFHEMNNNEEAIAWYKKAIGANPNISEAYYGLGQIYEDMGKKEESIGMYRKAMVIDPSYLLVYVRLVSLYEMIGKNDEIISLYKKAIENKLCYFEAYFNIGNLFCDMGRYKEAILLYKTAVGICPKSALTYVNLGAAYYAIGKTREALVFLKKAAVLNPSLRAAHANLAVAYYYEKKYDLALVHCNKAIEQGCKVSPELLEKIKSFRE
jgi:tetratricopeptide (TPR) repeat protein